MKKIIVLVGIFIGLGSSFLWSQHISAKWVADKQQILIGEQFQVTLTIEHDANIQIKPFEIPDTLQGFEVVRKTPAITGQQKGSQTLQQNFTFTHFDSGVYQLPTLPVFYQIGEDTVLQAVYTQPITIKVNTVAADTTKPFKPIYPIQTTAFVWQEAMPYAISFAIVLLIAAIIYLIWWRKKRKKTIAPPPPPRRLSEICLSQLQKIETDKKWEQLSPKLYYTELTEILRYYLNKRYNIHTLEATSDELLAQMQDKIAKEQYFTLSGILRTADLAKFAKLETDKAENIQNFEAVKQWITTTKDDRLIDHTGEIVQTVSPQK